MITRGMGGGRGMCLLTNGMGKVSALAFIHVISTFRLALEILKSLSIGGLVVRKRIEAATDIKSEIKQGLFVKAAFTEK